MPPRQRRQLPAQGNHNLAPNDDDAIIGELVQPGFISPQTLDRFAERDRDHEDLERFLGTVTNFTRDQQKLAREHAEQHPDAIEMRRTQNFRRVQYVVLLALVPFIMVGLLYVTLPVATIFGIILILIVSGTLVNGRDREMDLNGFVRMINTIVGRKDK